MNIHISAAKASKLKDADDASSYLQVNALISTIFRPLSAQTQILSYYLGNQFRINVNIIVSVTAACH